MESPLKVDGKDETWTPAREALRDKGDLPSEKDQAATLGQRTWTPSEVCDNCGALGHKFKGSKNWQEDIQHKAAEVQRNGRALLQERGQDTTQGDDCRMKKCSGMLKKEDGPPRAMRIQRNGRTWPPERSKDVTLGGDNMQHLGDMETGTGIPKTERVYDDDNIPKDQTNRRGTRVEVRNAYGN